ncbi:MAG: UvrB/UvrC motif-containing protein [Methylacidiphilales bacterium]|nr:UvrB/UvrC motif-containing protein [Candidatus Methylacidiphilales bacterium]MDW8349214.1 UvrB/UvrC motif-containing protein [Verrucomicrobiae bacterium]
MPENRPHGCENCKKAATVHLTQIVNGVLNKLDMCDSCPHAKEIDDPTGFSLADVLLGLGASQQMQASTSPNNTCPACGFTLNDFRKTGRLGCSQCYEVFRDGLIPILKDMHKTVQHKGKQPQRLIEKAKYEARLRELRAQLQKAIENEQYEQAAIYRDHIMQLQSKISEK